MYKYAVNFTCSHVLICSLVFSFQGRGSLVTLQFLPCCWFLLCCWGRLVCMYYVLISSTLMNVMRNPFTHSLKKTAAMFCSSRGLIVNFQWTYYMLITFHVWWCWCSKPYLRLEEFFFFNIYFFYIFKWYKINKLVQNNLWITITFFIFVYSVSLITSGSAWWIHCLG